MSEKERGTCQECGEELALTKAGRIWTHKRVSGGPTCGGSGKEPEQKAVRVPLGKKKAAPVTAADDVLMQAEPIRKEPKRDRWGRYLLPHPETGKRQGWTRATTFAKSISDTFALSQWSQRMTLKGAALRPDLVSLAHGLDVKADRDPLNKLVEQAKEAAGQKIAANLGTALHGFTESIDRGKPESSVPPQHLADVSAYTAAMKAAGIEVVPHLIERITSVPRFDVAGTFDRVLRLPDGTYAVGDLKTGNDLQYGWQEIAIQIAMYAYGVNESGVYDLELETWLPPKRYGDSPEKGSWDVPEVRTDFGIVMHLPVGKAVCTLYKVDLTQGWAAADLCHSVREWRKRRKLAEPFRTAEIGEVQVAVVREPTWEERFESASSRGELASLFDRARSAALGEGRLRSLTILGLRRLTVLEEPAG